MGFRARRCTLIAAGWWVVFAATSRADEGPSRASPPASAAPPAHESPWAGSLSPYLWLSSLSVDTGERTRDVNVGEMLELLDAAFMVYGEASYQSFEIAVDYAFIKLGTTRALGSGTAKLNATQHVLDLRGSYVFLNTRKDKRDASPGLELMVDMGTRYWKIDSALALHVPPIVANGPGIDATPTEHTSWWDWIVGLRGRYRATDRIAFAWAGNIGGFKIGNSSRFTWELTGGALFRVWKLLYLDVGYRVLQFQRQETDRGGELRLEKTTAEGLLFGVSAMF